MKRLNYASLSMRAGLYLAALSAILVTTSATIGQKVRLRSQVTPNCTQVRSSSGWKFADLYGDGNIAVQGSYGCNGAFIYDISDPDAPVLASRYNPEDNKQFLEAIVIGNRGYFGVGAQGTSTSTGDGVHIVDLTDPYTPVLIGKVNASVGGGYNTIHEMMVFDQGPKRYLMENSNLTSNKPIRIFDITDPAAPVLKWSITGGDNGWIHAMHIRGDRLFTSEYTGSRVEIYNIGNLNTTSPTLLGIVNVGSQTNHSTWTSEDGKYLYSARETFDGDIRVYDIQDPASPVLIRSIKAGDLGINAVTPHNPVVMGNYLYVSWYQAGIQVFDLTDPTFPKRVGQYDTFSPAYAPTEAQKQALLNADPWDMICGRATSLRESTLPSNYDGNWAVYPFLGQNKVLAGDLTSGLLILDTTEIAAPPVNRVSDFDGDKKTDISRYSPATGVWNIENVTQTTVQFGAPGDVIQPGDYDGDGKTDIAVWRPSTGVWYFQGSTSGFGAVQFGSPGDIPVSADYDADGRTDVAVWRPSNGVWYIQRSTLGFKAVQWGTAGDKPLTGDYEGDGKPDLTVWRPSNGVWYILRSSSTIPIYAQFGQAGDRPVLADLDGNGTSDLTVYRPSTGAWFALDPGTLNFTVYNFGIAEDIPVAADYDGDGKTDIAVFRPSANTWYRVNSSDGAFVYEVSGEAGDIPSPSSINP